MTGENRGRIKAAVFLGLAFALWMFGPKVPLDRYFTPTPGERNPSALSSYTTQEETKNLTDLTDLSTPAPQLVDDHSKIAIQKCLPELQMRTGEITLEETINYLRSSRSAELNTEIENLHIKTQDGRELRLMISPSDEEGFDGLIAQLFSVDREGLPIFEKLPLRIEPRDLEGARDWFLNQGNLTFSETTYLYRDDAHGITGKLIYNHDQLSGAELFKDGRFLGCSKSISSQSVACKCL